MLLHACTSSDVLAHRSRLLHQSNLNNDVQRYFKVSHHPQRVQTLSLDKKQIVTAYTFYYVWSETTTLFTWVLCALERTHITCYVIVLENSYMSLWPRWCPKGKICELWIGIVLETFKKKSILSNEKNITSWQLAEALLLIKNMQFVRGPKHFWV